MTDRISKRQRSHVMRSVGRTDTGPEVEVRSLLHRSGFRFRKNVRSLPGTPDIVLPRYRTVVFVHGCFWHQHPGCRRATKPASRQEYWDAKLARNIERDREKSDRLIAAGWRVIVVWECETAEPAKLIDRLSTVIRDEVKP
ncbi:DNA mismatch endonuclease Vsr [bacterium]|nr:DNA mismatch endonuclease Vsr [bacterium]